MASLPVERLLVVTAINDAHPPLYYVLLNVWTAFVGTGEAAVRALSLLIGAAAVPVVWGVGRRLVGSDAALVAAGLVALAPGQVAAGQEARMYGLLTLTALLSWWALWTAARTSAGRGPWVGYGLAVAAMLYSHYYGFFVVAAQAVYLLWVRPPLTVWKRWAASGLVVVVLLLPWIPALLGQIASGRAWPTFRPPLRPVLLADTLASLVVGRPIFDPMGVDVLHPAAIWMLAAAGAIVLAAGVWACRLAGRGEALALLLSTSVVPLVLAFAVSFKVHVFAPRYFTFALPGLALLTGAALVGQPSRRSATWLRALVVGACAVVLAMNAAVLARFYQQPRLDVFDWRRVSATLAAAAQPSDAIVFLPGFARIPVNYYFPGPQPRLALEPRVLDPEGPRGPRMSLLVTTLADRPRVWIVTVPPVPPSVDTLITALGRRSYGVTQRRDVNMARLILLERGRRR